LYLWVFLAVLLLKPILGLTDRIMDGEIVIITIITTVVGKLDALTHYEARVRGENDKIHYQNFAQCSGHNVCISVAG
jgi:hypothetical protein